MITHNNFKNAIMFTGACPDNWGDVQKISCWPLHAELQRISKNNAKAVTHYTRNCKKCSYLSYTLQPFFTTATIIFTVFYMSMDFLTDFFRKIFAVLCVVCEGLETGWLTDPMLSDMMPGMSNKIVCEFKNWQYLAWLVYKGKK